MVNDDNTTSISYTDYNNFKIINTDCVTDPRSCDINVYVSWLGTDKNGDFMISGH